MATPALSNGSSHELKAISGASEAPAVSEENPLSASYQQTTLIFFMLLFGVLIGLIAFVYDGFMDFSLHIVWKAIPEAMVASAEKSDGGLEFLNNWGWMYTIIVSTVLGALAGLSIKLLGNPGDLPDVINCVHKEGYVPIQQTLPMIFCSLFSIAAGGSLGPEAPLVAISSSTCGWLSMHYFMHDPVMVRKCTIIGMSAGLSAFFGVQLGGALFALEVLHTMGMQFFDVVVYAVGAGGVSLVVYRGLQGEMFGAIWDFKAPHESSAAEVLLGVAIGAVAGSVALVFRSFFRRVGEGVSLIGLGHFEDTHAPVILAALGGFCISILGVLVPPTMFWAELEIGVIADPSLDLPHVWPPGGVFYGLERYPWDSGPMYLLVGLTKLVAIALTLQAGFRGGFIFPLFFAGAAIGRGLLVVTDFLPPSLVHASPALVCMCLAAGLNVAVTRTPFASPLILATLSGAPNVMVPALCAALASLFMTRSSLFIGTQSDRRDIKYIGYLKPLRQTPKPEGHGGMGGYGKVDISSPHAMMEFTGNNFAPAEMSSLLNGTSQSGDYNAVDDASNAA